MMDHPHIAKVFDGGTTDDGRPFVVMELVEGVPITAYCDEQRLGLEQRLQLFMTVCRALHHAHQKGIIHRDLKPSNVLITRCDNQPVPKIIDFGVAKTTHATLDAIGAFTCQGDVIGTPQYWSPEQAGLNPHDIDIRSDIYGLGLLLYELLTGQQPFATETGSAIGILELVRAIRETDPPPPSTVSISDDFAHARQLSSERISRRLRGELDWIVMKCLEKDRNRRFESADGLANDIGRYLADEPVAAGPPSASYRLRKFSRKHRRPLAAASVLVLALVGGTIGTTVGMVRAARAEAEARDHEQRANQRFALAQTAVHSYLAAITEDEELKRSDHHELRLRLLKSAIPFFQQLAAEQPNHPEQILSQAVALGRHAELVRELGDLNAVRASLENAQAILFTIPEGDHEFDGHLELARVKRRLGDLAVDQADTDLANREYRSAVTILEQLIARNPNSQPAILDLARTFNNMGLLIGNEHIQLSGDYFSKSVELLDELSFRYGRTRESLELQSVCLNNLGNHLIERQDYSEANRHLTRALELTNQLVVDDPRSPALTLKRAGLQANLARISEAQNDLSSAQRGMEAAAEAMNSLVKRFPYHTEYRVHWAGIENNAAMLQASTGDPSGALARHDHVVKALNNIPALKRGLYADFLSNAHAGRAAALQMLKRNSEAVEAWKKSIASASDELKPLRESNYAVLLAKAGQIAEAREIITRLESDHSHLVLYNVACVYAILHQKQNLETDAGRAVSMLKQSIQLGYAQRDHIERDPDLESLHQREDYRMLMEHTRLGTTGTTGTTTAEVKS